MFLAVHSRAVWMTGVGLKPCAGMVFLGDTVAHCKNTLDDACLLQNNQIGLDYDHR